MDSEKFFDVLTDKVNAVSDAASRMEHTKQGSAENYRAVLEHRMLRDELISVVGRYPELFVGLLLALAASANETYAGVNDRISKLETAMFDSQDNVDTPLGYLSTRMDYLSERIDGMGAV